MKNEAGLRDMIQYAKDVAAEDNEAYPIYRVFDRDAPDMTDFDCLGRDRSDLIATVLPDGSVIPHHKWAEEVLR